MDVKVYPSVMDVHIVEGGQIVAEATLTSHVSHFNRAWQMSFIEVDARHRRKGYGAKLYHWAKAYAEERGCRLLPSPDLTWDGFSYWRVMDPQGLFEVLNDESTIGVIKCEGCDFERFQEQLAILKNERAN